MNLLGSINYDPGTAATKGSAASVMAAFDTTNARIAFTVPAHGMVRVIVQCAIHGATTFSQIMLGALEGATLRGRVTPWVTVNGTALPGAYGVGTAGKIIGTNLDATVSSRSTYAGARWRA